MHLIGFPGLCKILGFEESRSSRVAVSRLTDTQCFPQAIHISERRVRWVVEEVTQWIAERAALRDEQTEALAQNSRFPAHQPLDLLEPSGSATAEQQGECVSKGQSVTLGERP